MSNISIELLESDGMIIKKIHTSLAKVFNKSLKNDVGKIRADLRPIVANAIFASPELSSLSSGTLAVDFGLTTDPAGPIVNSIVQSLDIDIQQAVATAGGIKGGLLITMQPIDYSNLFSLYPVLTIPSNELVANVFVAVSSNEESAVSVVLSSLM